MSRKKEFLKQVQNLEDPDIENKKGRFKRKI